MARSPARLVLSLLVIAACKRPAADGVATVRVEAVAPAPASASASPKALPTSDAVGAAPNLLDLVPARVAVSSTVENPRDFPEFLVDGKSDTAWNGKSGDLVGGTISFRLPADVQVERIEMSAGYDRRSRDIDYFTANHRITSVEIARDGTILGTYPLDPNNRGVQALPVVGPGGDYRIKVLATLPGTNHRWKELVVSELRVIGAPGVERRDPSEPLRVVVGSLDQEPDRMADEAPTAIPEAYPSVAAFCAHVLADFAADGAQLAQTASFNGLTLRPASCAQIRELPLEGAGATYRRAFVVKASDGIGTTEQVVVEVARGVVPPGALWFTDDPLDPGCPSSVRTEGLRTIRVENGHVVVILDARREGMKPDGTMKMGRLRIPGEVLSRRSSARSPAGAKRP